MFSPVYVSVGANRLSGCASWSLGAHNNTADTPDNASVVFEGARIAAFPRDGLVAFGGGAFVCLYDPAVRFPACCEITY